jgi:membrane-anchored protein YejM (alkaline phosphatase superfamily)
MYGLDQPETEPFGRQCLLARRMVEKGVRFVLVVHGWENGAYSWDHHRDIKKSLPARVREVDQPVAALLKDLKQRGMFNDTLVVWTSEMGRTSFAEGGTGRNHNQWGLVSWFAGGGIRGGADCGGTDDFGLRAAADPIPIRDVHATVLQLLGLDNQALTYLHEGRYKRLTDTGGRVLKEILTT